MKFCIQAGFPDNSRSCDINDSKLSEAIESAFPMNTESLIMFWDHIAIPLSYKYDISYMIDDIIMLLQHIQMEETGEIIIPWLPDTFRVDWKVRWNIDTISIRSNWVNTVGDLQEILIDHEKIKLIKKDFINEWKKPLEIIIRALDDCGYSKIIKNQYNILLDTFISIQDYGMLYQN